MDEEMEIFTTMMMALTILSTLFITIKCYECYEREKVRRERQQEAERDYESGITF